MTLLLDFYFFFVKEVSSDYYSIKESFLFRPVDQLFIHLCNSCPCSGVAPTEEGSVSDLSLLPPCLVRTKLGRLIAPSVTWFTVWAPELATGSNLIWFHCIPVDQQLEEIPKCSVRSKRQTGVWIGAPYQRWFPWGAGFVFVLLHTDFCDPQFKGYFLTSMPSWRRQRYSLIRKRAIQFPLCYRQGDSGLNTTSPLPFSFLDLQNGPELGVRAGWEEAGKLSSRRWERITLGWRITWAQRRTLSLEPMGSRALLQDTVRGSIRANHTLWSPKRKLELYVRVISAPGIGGGILD